MTSRRLDVRPEGSWLGAKRVSAKHRDALRLGLATLLLGPLTGPLALGFANCLRSRRYPMAGIYLLGIAEVVIGLPWVVGTLAERAF